MLEWFCVCEASASTVPSHTLREGLFFGPFLFPLTTRLNHNHRFPTAWPAIWSHSGQQQLSDTLIWLGFNAVVRAKQPPVFPLFCLWSFRVCLVKEIRFYLIKPKRAIWLLILPNKSYLLVLLIDQLLVSFFFFEIAEIKIMSLFAHSWLQGELQHNRQHWRNRLQRHLLHLGCEWRGQGTKHIKSVCVCVCIFGNKCHCNFPRNCSILFTLPAGVFWKQWDRIFCADSGVGKQMQCDANT